MASREKAGQILSAQSGGRGVAAAWAHGCLVVTAWSEAVIKFPR